MPGPYSRIRGHVSYTLSPFVQRPLYKLFDVNHNLARFRQKVAWRVCGVCDVTCAACPLTVRARARSLTTIFSCSVRRRRCFSAPCGG